MSTAAAKIVSIRSVGGMGGRLLPAPRSSPTPSAEMDARGAQRSGETVGVSTFDGRTSTALEFPVQPGAGVGPVPLGGRFGNAHRRRGLLDRQAREVAEVDQPG